MTNTTELINLYTEVEYGMVNYKQTPYEISRLWKLSHVEQTRAYAKKDYDNRKNDPAFLEYRRQINRRFSDKKKKEKAELLAEENRKKTLVENKNI